MVNPGSSLNVFLKIALGAGIFPYLRYSANESGLISFLNKDTFMKSL